MFFKIDALTAWEGVVPKEILQFEAPQPRRVRLAFNTNAPVEVWAAFPVEPVEQMPDGSLVEAVEPDMRDALIAYGSGLFEVEFTTHGTTFVRCLADDETAIFVRGFAADMRVPESEEEIYTSIIPRERRNTEFDRMVMWTKLNEMRREAQLSGALAELEQIKASLQPQEAPASASTAEPEGAGDGA